ncbi:MAG: acyl-CoA dehydrogenase family protein [Lysinibacillus sp.]
MAIDLKGLQTLIDQELKPVVKKVDEDAFYAEQYIYALGKNGFFSSANKTETQYLIDELTVVYETSKTCMTTAFCVWCHLAAQTYLRKSTNEFLKSNILPKLENGEQLGATGLSNPMKYFAGLEKLHLSAEATDNGYIVNGVLPAVSNLGDNHWFGVIAAVEEREVMLLVSSTVDGLELKGKTQFVGVNGSATYSCRFTNVFIPAEQVIAEDAKDFCNIIRPTFILYQIPLGLGVSAAAADGIDKVKAKQNGCNEFLRTQSIDVKIATEALLHDLVQTIESEAVSLQKMVELRLNDVYSTLNAVQANMLHNGAAGYVSGSVADRKLREAYFFANLTPTVRQLEKMTASFKATKA